jgi:integrase
MGIYRRGENWYIDFRFKGVRVRESIGPSRKMAEKVLRKKKNEIDENKYLDIRKEPEPIKFHAFAKEYLQWAKTNKKTSTYIRDVYIMRQFDERFHGRCLHEITGWLIEKWKSERKEKCQIGTVNRELALLKHIFAKAVEWKDEKNKIPFLKENPTRGIKRLKGENRRLRYLLPEEVQTLLSNCDGLLGGFLKPMVTLALYTGARKGELQGLQWPQVDLGLGIITLLDTKNGERRDIHMGDAVKIALEGLNRKSDYVFSNRNNKRIDNAALQLAFKEALRKSQIEDFHFHDLRHTFASNLVMNGIELNDIRELLGHKRMEMTLRYSHLSPKHKGKVVNVLDRVFGGTQISPQIERVVNLKP